MSTTYGEEKAKLSHAAHLPVVDQDEHDLQASPGSLR